MKFSIVTISFNQKQFLRQCIESVLSQNKVDLEYIVVDPGSSDGSRELIESYGDRIVKIFEPDDGPADGLNKGFLKASGDALGYINSDDYLLPNTLSSALYHLIDNTCDVVHGNAIVVDEQNNILRNVYSDRFNLNASAYGSCILIQPSAYFTKRAFTLAGGFNNNNRTNWDGELFIDMGIAGIRFKKVSNFFSAYRVHRDSITGSGKFADKHQQYQNLMYEKITGKKHNCRNELIEAFYKNYRRVTNFRDTVERIVHGPVFGRAS